MGRYLLEGDSSWLRTCSSCGGAWHCRPPVRSDVDPGWTCERCADNAALLDTLRRARAVIDDVAATPGFRMGAGMGVEMVINQPHPGAALLERVKRLEAIIRHCQERRFLGDTEDEAQMLEQAGMDPDH